jgi:pyruvate kinase
VTAGWLEMCFSEGMSKPDLEQLRNSVREIRAQAEEQAALLGDELRALHPTHQAAGQNLAHYLALRQHDVRDLQRGLAMVGLSSLGCSEHCVMATLNAVDHALGCLLGVSEERLPTPPIDFEAADVMLRERTEALLGPPPSRRTARVMATLSTDADARTISALLTEGADLVRINCAKGAAADWQATIQLVRSAASDRGRACAVLCDLAGPNPRTAALADDASDVLGRVGVGDEILLCKRQPSPKSANVAIGCTLPEVLDDLSPGDRVYYDDGKLAGVVREVTPGGACVEIRFARKERVKVKAGKGLNFPDTKLTLPSLTDKDRVDLEFVARHADLVGLSFVRSVDHVRHLQRELARLGAKDLGVILKIETTQAFEALPRLLLTAMQGPRVGVMVARGDMAIELGFERLAEAQEEVLWLSEAALVPVIWATQVLEGLNKTGVPSRAEVTDAAMSGRAECVMLNQGDHQIEATRFLCNVLERMQAHQEKKRSMLRRLGISSVTWDR